MPPGPTRAGLAAASAGEAAADVADASYWSASSQQAHAQRGGPYVPGHGITAQYVMPEYPGVLLPRLPFKASPRVPDLNAVATMWMQPWRGGTKTWFHQSHTPGQASPRGGGGGYGGGAGPNEGGAEGAGLYSPRMQSKLSPRFRLSALNIA